MNGLLQLSDGRQIEYLDNGVGSERALVLHHGSPCEAFFWTTTLKQLASKGVRAVAYTRPGYGESTRLPDRNLIDGNRDLAAVLEHLDVAKFVSVGWSAGGPTALASGLLDGCHGVVAVASPAPFDADDLDFYDGMGADFAEECAATVMDLDTAFKYKQEHTEGLKSLSVEDILGGLAPRSSRPEFYAEYRVLGHDLLTTLKRGLTPDAMGYTEDDRSFLKPWGFYPGALSVPVQIWLGRNDPYVPVAHAEWLHEHINDSELHLLEDHDHISTWVEHCDQFLADAIETLAR